MAIVFHTKPNTLPMSWEEFRLATGPFAIAIDGYVDDGPQQDYGPTGPRQNFDHHKAVYRPATRATCAQVLVEVRVGLFERFRDADGPRADVYRNDCDEDVCTSSVILKHSHLARPTINPLLNRLVGLVDKLDTFAGGYPFDKDLLALRELAWIFDPYRRFRFAGGIDRRVATEFDGVIDDVERRILAYLAGRGEQLPLDLRYEVTRHGDGWVMVREIGAQARTAMLADGIRTFLSVRERPDGARTVTIGKFSPHTPGDLAAVCTNCNAAEGRTSGDVWGGGTTVIGSPRVSGTRLDDQTLAEIMDRHFEHPAQ
ncbi:MAG: hypothetical protein Q7S02_04790 [bacterium]|nr:hypothetical protein [bacterium]